MQNDSPGHGRMIVLASDLAQEVQKVRTPANDDEIRVLVARIGALIDPRDEGPAAA